MPDSPDRRILVVVEAALREQAADRDTILSRGTVDMLHKALDQHPPLPSNGGHVLPVQLELPFEPAEMDCA